MKVGRKKADFRIKIIHKSGKSQAFPIYDCDLSIQQMVKKIIETLRQE